MMGEMLVCAVQMNLMMCLCACAQRWPHLGVGVESESTLLLFRGGGWNEGGPHFWDGGLAIKLA